MHSVFLFCLFQGPAIQVSSYVKMEGVLIPTVCATITMTVETTVMNLDAVSVGCTFIHVDHAQMKRVLVAILFTNREGESETRYYTKRFLKQML